jgi:uncharacterized damage-inducible protein DinB
MRNFVSSIEGEWRRYKTLGEGAIQQVRDDELGRDEGGNSIAVIVWHIGGNLKSRFTDFLDTDGEKPWRNRDTEFDDRSNIKRTELLDKWNSGWDALFTALETLSDEDLSRTVTIRGVKCRVHEALHRAVAHTSYHVGQIVVLAKGFRGSEWKSLSIPRGKSEQYNQHPDPARERPANS